jgi:hypothetical protein
VQYTPPARTPFDWLRDPADRASALRQIESALVRGWLDPQAADVAPLKAVLTELIEDPTTTVAQGRRMRRVLSVLDRGRAGHMAAERRRLRPPA